MTYSPYKSPFPSLTHPIAHWLPGIRKQRNILRRIFLGKVFMSWVQEFTAASDLEVEFVGRRRNVFIWNLIYNCSFPEIFTKVSLNSTWMFGLNDNEAFDNRDFHPSGPIYSFIYHSPFINISIAYRHKLIISPPHSVSFKAEASLFSRLLCSW